MHPEQQQLIDGEISSVSTRFREHRHVCETYRQEQESILEYLQKTPDTHRAVIAIAGDILEKAFETEIESTDTEQLWDLVHPAWSAHNIYGLTYYERTRQIELLDVRCSPLSLAFPNEDDAMHMELYIKPDTAVVMQGNEIPKNTKNELYQRAISHILASMQISEFERVE